MVYFYHTNAYGRRDKRYENLSKPAFPEKHRQTFL